MSLGGILPCFGGRAGISFNRIIPLRWWAHRSLSLLTALYPRVGGRIESFSAALADALVTLSAALFFALAGASNLSRRHPCVGGRIDISFITIFPGVGGRIGNSLGGIIPLRWRAHRSLSLGGVLPIVDGRIGNSLGSMIPLRWRAHWHYCSCDCSWWLFTKVVLTSWMGWIASFDFVLSRNCPGRSWFGLLCPALAVLALACLLVYFVLVSLQKENVSNEPTNDRQ